LIIVIAIMGVILAAVTTMFFFSNDTFGKTSDQQTVQSDVRLISTFIEDELKYAHELEVLDTIPATLEATKRYIYLDNGRIMFKEENESVEEIRSAFDFIDYTLAFDKYNSTVLNYQLTGEFEESSFTVDSDIEILNMKMTSSDSEIVGTTGIGVKYTLASDKNTFIEFNFLSEVNVGEDDNPILNSDYYGVISDNRVYIHVPSDTVLTSLIPSFKTEGNSVDVDETSQESGVTPEDFSSPVTYTIVAENGVENYYTVYVKTLR